jgi:hypothetical protein
MIPKESLQFCSAFSIHLPFTPLNYWERPFGGGAQMKMKMKNKNVILLIK